MLRCKVRCTSVMYDLNGSEAVFRFVVPRIGDWPGGSAENAQFWSSLGFAPGASLRLRFTRDASPFASPGDYFLVDFEEVDGDDDVAWALQVVDEEPNSTDLQFSLKWDALRLSMACGSAHLEVTAKEARSFFQGKEGTLWALSFYPSNEEHPDCPFTVGQR